MRTVLMVVLLYLRAATPAVEFSPTTDFLHLPIASIDESTTNPRATCSADALDELTAGIRLCGVLQPILVRAVGERYELIAGSHRLRAALLADLTTIPARVVVMDDQAARETQIIENLQREEVHPLEEPEAYEKLMARDGAYTVDVLAAKVGKSVTYVYTRLTLTRLILEVRAVFRRDVITAAHAQRRATVPPAQQPEALRQCFFRLLNGADDEDLDRHNLAPMRQLDDWLRTKVALNVHDEATKQLLPELASDVAEQVEAGAQILALSTLHFHTDKRDPMPILARSWKLAEGRATCEHARPGVIVLGDDRGGRVLRVCIEKKRCTKHWGQRTSAADRADQGARAKAETDRAAKDRARAERERVYWTRSSGHLSRAASES